MKERKHKVELLRRAAEHDFNARTYHKKEGEILLMRRPKGNAFQVDNYGPQYCLPW